MAKESRNYRKQILLFLLVFVLPCVVLVFLSLRIIDQEQELAEKRASDEHRRITAEMSQYLFTKLETIKNQELGADSLLNSHINPEVVLFGQVEDNQLKFPWEIQPEGESGFQSLHQPDFTRKIQQAEEEELVKKDYSRAAFLYRQILKTPISNTQQAYAHLLLARVMMKAGQQEEAFSLYKNILTLHSNITDEFGIPFFVYASERLTDNSVFLNEVSERISEGLNELRWLSPLESYMTSSICEKLINTASETTLKDLAKENLSLVQENISVLDQSLLLRRDFPGLLRNLQNETVWTAYGENPWLLSLTSPLLDSKSVLIAVSAAEVLETLQKDESLASIIPQDVRFVVEGTGVGEYLGPSFRSIR
ncbi:tol-pal system YbgF family protein, partial [Acidobacteriota bacterium]